MNSTDIVVVCALVALTVFQAILTRRVWRSDLYDRPQKLTQTRLVWFVPLVGAVIVFMMLSHASGEDQRARR